MKLELLSRQDYVQPQQNIEFTKAEPTRVDVAKVIPIEAFRKTDNSTSQKAINDTVNKVNKMIANTGTTLEMSVYEPTHEIQVKIKDSEGKVIKEIPSKKMLELGAYMRKLAGIIVDKEI